MDNQTKIKAATEAHRRVLESVAMENATYPELFEQAYAEELQKARVSKQADLSIYVPGSSTKKVVDTEDTEDEEKANDDD